MDHVLTTGKRCPKYDKAYADNLKSSPEVQRIHAEHKDLFSSLSQNSGAKISTTTDVYKLYNTLMVEKEHNKL